ncbi:MULTISPECIES: ATP-binding cassette domain-containing protein [Isoptericola]|uniref:ATP-binding cassette domain-containing protein n=1 Tax=Isoptericola sediminis TaxID=2733572 RepID=A0A849K1K8_9MICO|nr:MULTISPECIES: ATP-binding cassette domain-containing protein [Isoptericola]MDO8145865.1 ATP-binding cassette domain-containing protein [Isoptericola sp. 178]MDO8147801.1 ATP-binding cassette domain-containing protein [Isoptericola sp. b515]NNU27058.1 ATP-binding cassette domain-containing protein [Isoptericola sediminis]
MSETAIVTRAIERRFGDNVAVAGVDLTVHEGEMYGFLGPNGAGKSTLTRLLCTLLAPTGGTATVAGHDVVHEPTAVRLRIGVALQEAALDDKQTGVEMLRLQGRFYGLTARETTRRVAELRELIDIGDALDDRVGTYSGGMKRRLDLALALIHNPRILFLDEPTTGLDPISRATVWAEVRRLNRELGVTVFLTTQYLEEADALADRVGIINRGELVAEGTPGELKRSIGTDVLVVEVGDQVENARTTLRTLDAGTGIGGVETDGTSLMVSVDDGARAVSPVALALDRAGITVQQLALRHPTLDDVFFRVTGHRIQDDEGEAP